MRKVTLTKQVMQILKPALLNAKGTIKREIAQGISHLYITSNNLLYLVFRPEGEQLVVVVAAGKKLRDSRQEIIAFAKQGHFTSVRFHTKHPEYLAKGMADLPIHLTEIRKGVFSSEFIFKINLSEV
jgi:ribosomal protein S11